MGKEYSAICSYEECFGDRDLTELQIFLQQYQAEGGFDSPCYLHIDDLTKAIATGNLYIMVDSQYEIKGLCTCREDTQYDGYLIGDVYVLQKYRHQGIAHHLISYVEGHKLWMKKPFYICLGANSLRTFYEEQGYEVVPNTNQRIMIKDKS